MLLGTDSILRLVSRRLGSRSGSIKISISRLSTTQRINMQIVKERQMDFDIETDPETMFELFGEDYKSFAE